MLPEEISRGDAEIVQLKFKFGAAGRGIDPGKEHETWSKNKSNRVA